MSEESTDPWPMTADGHPIVRLRGNWGWGYIHRRLTIRERLSVWMGAADPRILKDEPPTNDKEAEPTMTTAYRREPCGHIPDCPGHQYVPWPELEALVEAAASDEFLCKLVLGRSYASIRMRATVIPPPCGECWGCRTHNLGANLIRSEG